MAVTGHWCSDHKGLSCSKGTPGPTQKEELRRWEGLMSATLRNGSRDPELSGASRDYPRKESDQEPKNLVNSVYFRFSVLLSFA